MGAQSVGSGPWNQSWRGTTLFEERSEAVDSGRGGWVRARACTAGSCVEVQRLGGRAFLRDSKLLDEYGETTSIVEAGPTEWESLLSAVADDAPSLQANVGFRRRQDDSVEIWGPGVMLRFDDAEWKVFQSGVRLGEFDLPA